ncbi:MAG: polyphosphate kinase 1 [bacterium]|nr:polyphosphate kinase 1 [bacterium]
MDKEMTPANRGGAVTGYGKTDREKLEAKLRQDESVLPASGSRCFTDRELSWLQFNLRVLNEAGNRNVPLLERLKFLSIYYSNLDEFFMVRVGSLTHRNVLLPYYTDPKTGYTAATQIKKVLAETARQQAKAESIYRELLHDLSEKGIDVLDFRRLSKEEETIARKVFAEHRPLLSPRVVDARHPLPFLGNKESYMAALLGKGEEVSLGLVSLYRLPKFTVFEVSGRQKVLIMSELVRYMAAQLFKKYELRESCVVRLTRNADVFIEEDLRSYDADYRASMEKMLRKRKRQQPVRLQIDGRPSKNFRTLLEKSLHVNEKNTFISTVPFDLGFGGEVHRTADMKYPERKSVRSVKLRKGEYFRYLDKHDLLLSFPHQSMMPFIEMLYEAADDPEVVSIRITLYRLAASSKVAAALAYAADQGKDVLCLLELRARFDEQNNIDYSEVLEDAGCAVIYGLPEQKVHSKLCLITRRCGDQVRYITQVGSGNYNEVTSEQYCDVSLITSDPAVGQDASAVFDALALGEVPAAADRLWVAPEGYKSRVLEMLERERAKGGEGFVAIKVNSLNDIDVMSALIDCSRAGVTVELYIRGICCLCPGIPGYTDNITVRSVVGRYLEHSRIFVFGRGAEQRIFMGSGDLLNRNTRRRVECFIEAVTPETREPLLEIMEALRQDRENGWVMQSDGSYILEEGGEGTSSQDRLYRYFSERIVENDPEPTREEETEQAKKNGFFAGLLRLFGWK